MLTRIEQETIITYNEQDSTAEVDTCNKSLIRKLDEYAKGTTSVIKVGEDKHGKRYIVPKKWVNVKKPRQYSEEEREKRANRLREISAQKQRGNN